MEQAFIETHDVAAVAVAVTLVGAAVVEWAVTYRERLRTAPPSGAGLAGRGRLAVSTLVETTTARTAGDAPADRGTKRILVGSMVGALVLGWLAASRLPGLSLPGSGWIWLVLGVALMWAGIGLRAWSIAVLGRFFRRDVVVQTGHEVVRAGPYRIVRHPAYAGNLIIAFGLGLALDNWLSLAILGVVPLLGHLPRIRVEETELERGLGEAYRRYEEETERLVPGVW